MWVKTREKEEEEESREQRERLKCWVGLWAKAIASCNPTYSWEDMKELRPGKEWEIKEKESKRKRKRKRKGAASKDSGNLSALNLRAFFLRLSFIFLSFFFLFLLVRIIKSLSVVAMEGGGWGKGTSTLTGFNSDYLRLSTALLISFLFFRFLSSSLLLSSFD